MGFGISSATASILPPHRSTLAELPSAVSGASAGEDASSSGASLPQAVEQSQVEAGSMDVIELFSAQPDEEVDGYRSLSPSVSPVDPEQADEGLERALLAQAYNNLALARQMSSGTPNDVISMLMSKLL